MRATTLDIERRRDRATLQSAIAKPLITQRQVERQRSRLVEREKARAALATLLDKLDHLLPTVSEHADRRDAGLMREAELLVTADLGDLQSEMLKLMQPDE